MNKIYPKIDDSFRGMHVLKKYIEKYKGVEIQILDTDENNQFSVTETVETLLTMCPNVEEITIHTPLGNYDLEMLLLENKQLILDQIAELKELSILYKIRFNLLYHTTWTFKAHQQYTVLLLKEILSSMKGFSVYLYLENVYENLEQTCTVLQLCKFMGDKQLRVCLDLCHIYCLSQLHQMDIESFLKKYLKKMDCEKYVEQIHFSAARNQDGFRNPKTHARMHEGVGDAVKDLEILYAYGMQEKKYVTEICEEDYRLRSDQAREIDMLEDIAKMMK